MPPRKIRVSRRNIEAWLRAVPRFDNPRCPAAQRYVIAWNVRDKILRAKLEGRWPRVLHE